MYQRVLDFFTRRANEIGKRPLRKPMAIGCVNFVKIVCAVVLGASIAGWRIPDEVLGFLQAIIFAMVVPMVGYYFTSTIEDRRHRVPGEKPSNSEGEDDAPQ